jgi:hypothetical protein
MMLKNQKEREKLKEIFFAFDFGFACGFEKKEFRVFFPLKSGWNGDVR